jgi:integrase/recombinase XerD
MRANWRPDLSDPDVQLGLAPRNNPYFNLLSYCRHVGLHVYADGCSYWVGRVRRKDGGYIQRRLLMAWDDGYQEQTYAEAVQAAERWFCQPDIQALASEPYQFGSRRELTICPMGSVYTVGHALWDYVEWKRIAATRSHFETTVNRINYHLVPRLAFVPIEEFSAKHFHDLAVAVLETPPKRGRGLPDARVPIEHLSEDQLRKRKKTFNALVSILRGAFELAWERCDLESDRPLRCLRRLPNLDRPRAVFLSRADCRRLIAACDQDLVQLVRAALFTGCRITELTKMRAGDFLEDKRAVFVANPKGRRTRYVFLPPDGVPFFRAIAEGRAGSDFLFRKANGRIWGSEYKSYFQRARIAADLPPDLTFHGLRHTYASQLVQSGASLIAVAEQLGHANTQTVSSTYGHLAGFHRRDEVALHFEALEGSVLPQDDSSAVSGLARLPRDAETSWPRSNFSKYSGPLLPTLRSYP